MAETRLRISLVAGEASGDILGAGLLAELGRRATKLQASGIAGPEMHARGCESWWPIEKLSVMGLAEVLKHLPELLRIRKSVRERVLRERPDVFIGIDAPDFNLGLEKHLKSGGIRTVHYVSPSVWAWRRGRAAKIGQSADLVLCLFPFEPDIYAEHGVHAEFVGHPLADAIPEKVDAATARRELGLPESGQWLAILPGSRMSEVSRLASPFLETADWLHKRLPELKFVIPAATPRIRLLLETELARRFPALDVRLIDGRSREVMAAADAVLLASGTATLECLLLKRPMVVSYRLSPLTYWIVRALRLLKVPYVSLPNVLAGHKLVPECLQSHARAEYLGPALHALLTDEVARAAQIEPFAEIHHRLRCNASARAAEAVLKLIGG